MKQKNRGLVGCAASKAGAKKMLPFIRLVLEPNYPPPPVEPLINAVTELCQNQSKLTLLDHALCQSIQTVVFI